MKNPEDLDRDASHPNRLPVATSTAEIVILIVLLLVAFWAVLGRF
jgi:hypothetical protein